MLENNKIHVSTDLRQRFIPRRTINISAEENNDSEIWTADMVTKGDFIIIKSDADIMFGRVLNFKRMNQRSKKESTYYRDTVEISASQNIGVYLDPLYLIVNGTKIVKEHFDFFDLSSYAYHVKSNINFSLRYVKDLLLNAV